MEIVRAAAPKEAAEGHDWRADVGVSINGLSVDLARARESGRGRQADTPEEIPPRGWRDILWRVFWAISRDRILSTVRRQPS
jgi:membrane protein